MENAAKALVIAGGVLLAMLVLTIGVYLVGTLGKVTDSYTTTLDAAELQKYNSNFEVFVGREDITAQEIVTLISFAKQKEQGSVIVIEGETRDRELDYTKCMEWEETEKNKFLQKKIEEAKTNNGVMTQYSYNSIMYDTDGKVSQIIFEKNS